MPRKFTVYIGIDNGVSGSIGAVTDSYHTMLKMPTKEELSYTKQVRRIRRIHFENLLGILSTLTFESGGSPKVFLERPMVNPMRFVATTSALRALEATLIAIEIKGFPVQYIDSKQWQKVMLPEGLKGADQLKIASRDIGVRTFPYLKDVIEEHGDADGLLMAEWARRQKL